MGDFERKLFIPVQPPAEGGLPGVPQEVTPQAEAEQEKDATEKLLEDTVNRIVEKYSDSKSLIKSRARINKEIVSVVAQHPELDGHRDVIYRRARIALTLSIYDDQFAKISEAAIADGRTVINMEFIRSNNNALAKKIYENILDDQGAVDYDTISKKLGIKVEPDKNYSREWSPENAVGYLAKLLERKRPGHFNRKWIHDNDRTLYLKLLGYISQGICDWNEIVAGLPDEMREGWTEGRVNARTATESYENENEVEEALGRYRDKLFTFIEAPTGEDRIARDEICRELVTLAQRGNTSARRIATELLRDMISSWILANELLGRFEGYMDVAHRKIESCIDNFDSRKSDSFVGYLYVSLKNKARGLPMKVGYEEGNRYNSAA